MALGTSAVESVEEPAVLVVGRGRQAAEACQSGDRQDTIVQEFAAAAVAAAAVAAAVGQEAATVVDDGLSALPIHLAARQELAGALEAAVGAEGNLLAAAGVEGSLLLAAVADPTGQRLEGDIAAATGSMAEPRVSAASLGTAVAAVPVTIGVEGQTTAAGVKH